MSLIPQLYSEIVIWTCLLVILANSRMNAEMNFASIAELLCPEAVLPTSSVYT